MVRSILIGKVVQLIGDHTFLQPHSVFEKTGIHQLNDNIITNSFVKKRIRKS